MNAKLLRELLLDLSVLAAVIFGWLAAMDWLGAKLF